MAAVASSRRRKETARAVPVIARGDTVGVVSPSFAVLPEALTSGVAALGRMGYRVKLGEHVLAQHGYLAGTDAQRAQDLNAMLVDPEVGAVWFSRGGYGAARIIDALDLAPLARKPKVLVGHSDLTLLFSAVLGRTGQICLHGPFVGELGRAASFHPPSLRKLLRGEGVVLPFRADQVLREGGAQGPLLGGNLTILAHALGTPFAPDLRGAVLLLEDVGEESYRLDRLLHHLRLAGALRELAAVIIGSLEAPPTRRAFPPDRDVEEILREVLLPLGVPVVTHLPLGHLMGKWTVPLGGWARLDTARGRLALDPRAPGRAKARGRA